VYAYATYRLLSRRIERDLLLVDSLLSPSPVAPPRPSPKSAKSGVAEGKAKESVVDPRINPGLVKLYDTILQSLEQMRNLSIVDESIDLVPSVESRLAFSRSKRYSLAYFLVHLLTHFLILRMLYLSRTYGTLKRYAEALSLTAKGHIYLREARSIISTSVSQQNEVKPEETYYHLTLDDVSRAEEELAGEETKMKMDWYAFNGGAATSAPEGGHKKPMFYDVAFNYVELPLERLEARAAIGQPGAKPEGNIKPALGATVTASAPGRSIASQASGATGENGKRQRRATKTEEAPLTPEVKIVQSSGFGIGGILGSWWGRQ
jgi:signal recognition particle subunit SRP68